MTRNLGPAEPPAPVGSIHNIVETSDGLVATGGLCAPMSPFYDWSRPWSRPRFAPVPFWRNWRRRWTAGGPLLGHVTPPTFRFRLPTFTTSRGGIRFVSPPMADR